MPAEEKAAEAKAQQKESERKEAEAKGAEKKSKKGKGKQRKDASDGMDVDLLLHTLKEIQVHGQDHEFDPDTDCGGREPPKALKELRTHEVFAPADGGQEDERPKRHRPERNWASVLNARNQSGPAKSLLK